MFNIWSFTLLPVNEENTDLMDMSLSKLRELVMDRKCGSIWDRKKLDLTE